MVELDQLDALDTLLWMRSSTIAAMATYSSQSTIIRRSRHALRVLGVDLYRGRSRWRILGDVSLLDLERQVHQEARFQGRSRLRLHMPWWTSRLLNAESARQIAKRWVCHPEAAQDRADDPISLLKDRVIDACLVTPTQTPSVDPDLYAVDIYQDDICLMALAGDRDVFVPEYGDSAGCRLRLFDFLPHSCKLASKHWFECRFGLVKSDSSKSEICPQPFVHVAYLTSTMVQALGIAACQDRSSPRPYVERLVVRHEHRERPEFQQLLIELSCGLSQSHRGPVGLVAA